MMRRCCRVSLSFALFLTPNPTQKRAHEDTPALCSARIVFKLKMKAKLALFRKWEFRENAFAVIAALLNTLLDSVSEKRLQGRKWLHWVKFRGMLRHICLVSRSLLGKFSYLFGSQEVPSCQLFAVFSFLPPLLLSFRLMTRETNCASSYKYYSNRGMPARNDTTTTAKTATTTTTTSTTSP